MSYPGIWAWRAGQREDTAPQSHHRLNYFCLRIILNTWILRVSDQTMLDLHKVFESRSKFLANLSDAVNEIAGHDTPLPDEFLRLLELTDGVCAGHLAEFMPCGLGGTFLGGTLPYGSMRGGTESDGWSILTGWCTSVEKDNAETQLLYARKTGGTAEEAQWKWRVCVEDWSEDPSGEGRWFTSIADFLDYMAGWFERLPDGWEHERKYVPGLSDSEEDSDEDSEENESD